MNMITVIAILFLAYQQHITNRSLRSLEKTLLSIIEHCEIKVVVNKGCELFE